MQPLPSLFKPLSMQHRIHFGREYIRNAVALFPRGAKPVGIVAAAKEAGAMSRRERGRLSRKNSSVQLRPPITWRRRPRNSQTQVSHALLLQRRVSSVLVAGS